LTNLFHIILSRWQSFLNFDQVILVKLKSIHYDVSLDYHRTFFWISPLEICQQEQITNKSLLTKNQTHEILKKNFGNQLNDATYTGYPFL
jgi:hypothetical protein